MVAGKTPPRLDTDMEKSPAISVIVPIYKVSQFIERCADALMQQTLSDVEFIFVDDASPDDSRSKLENVLAGYPERNVRILTHDRNRGLPSARKSGFEASTGRYIYHCDGDDWTDITLLEKLYSAAVSNDADFVYCDFFLTFGENERYMHNPSYKTPDEMLRKGFLSGNCKYNYWNKLVKRELYEGVEFPVDHFKGGEDMVMIGILSRASRIAYVPEALYHYVKTNSGAISENFSQQRLESIRYNSDRAIEELQNYPGDLTVEIALFKLNVKLPFLLSSDKEKYAVWKDWFPEANSYIFSNTELPLRTKVLQWCAAHNLWLLVKAYYLLVYRFLYGVIYK